MSPSPTENDLMMLIRCDLNPLLDVVGLLPIREREQSKENDQQNAAGGTGPIRGNEVVQLQRAEPDEHCAQRPIRVVLFRQKFDLRVLDTAADKVSIRGERNKLRRLEERLNE